MCWLDDDKCDKNSKHVTLTIRRDVIIVIVVNDIIIIVKTSAAPSELRRKEYYKNLINKIESHCRNRTLILKS